MKFFDLVLLTLQLMPSFSSPTPETQSSRIVNGFEVDISEVSYHAALIRQVSLSWYYFCGAVVISDRAALTAAHCVSSFVSTPSTVRIAVGSSYRNMGGKAYDVSNVNLHEDYNTETLSNDIAMLVTVKEITFSESVGKIPFAPKGFDLPVGSEALVTGFGVTEFGGIASTTLLAANVTITSQETCARAYYEITTIYSGMICANSTDPPRDACQGDSGGPLVSKGHLVGIVSWGEGCADPLYPGVYTRISEYESWIVENLAGI